MNKDWVKCDGCYSYVQNSSNLSFRSADGRECRYCADCDATYAGWLSVLQAEENRLNSILNIFIAETRDKISLKLVPQDLVGSKGLGKLQ